MTASEDDPGRARPRWSGAARLLAAAAALVVVLGGVAVAVTLSNPGRLGVVFSGGAPASPATDAGGVGAAEAAGAQTLAAPRAGRQRAEFELTDGLTRFALRTADLGDDLYRIDVPEDAGVTPRPLMVGDRVRLRIEENGRRGPAAVDVVLNSRVTWRLRLVGGVSEQRLDLGEARLAGIDMVGGASRTRLLLPRLNGSLTVRMTGGVSELTVTVPGGPPVRVRVAAGAGSLTVYEKRHGGIAAGDLVSSPGWDRAADRLYLDLAAGANAVSVTED
ncbi:MULTISPECIES: hypothetical protein [unclassified Micromonospora]|uniref:hypothetical protein n=1 Tax=unclassified Micromonospora TaxID=2617518 RepID=UPI001B36A94B|nr:MULTISPECIES: hypothetical protein [unclassified Micromonospora]MBQ1041243.1 hypothetical protein [Micromonospora sp. C72]MBQ1054957.1 hypothetical protein [Micromonospora sp. C32]